MKSTFSMMDEDGKEGLEITVIGEEKPTPKLFGDLLKEFKGHYPELFDQDGFEEKELKKKNPEELDQKSFERLRNLEEKKKRGMREMVGPQKSKFKKMA